MTPCTTLIGISSICFDVFVVTGFELMTSVHLSHANDQCDPMAIFFSNYNNEKLPNSIRNSPKSTQNIPELTLNFVYKHV